MSEPVGGGGIMPAGGPPYRAFLEALRDLDEGSAEWRAAYAGFLVLRYVGAWSLGEWRSRELERERAAVTAALQTLSDGDVRARLGAIVEAATDERAADAVKWQSARGRLVQPLLSYGAILRARGAWAMAAEVYGVLWEASGGAAGLMPDAESASAAALAALHLGICYRPMGALDRAARAYGVARAVAAECADMQVADYVTQRARLGDALVARDRGNLPKAERLIEAVIEESGAPHLLDVRARAWHDRAVVAYRRGRGEEAIAWAYDAWRLATEAGQDSVQGERIVLDLATMLVARGYRSVAREANLYLWEMARGAFARWSAAVNLIELATLERRAEEFARWVAVVGHARRILVPETEGEYLYYTALGHQMFGDTTAAIAALDGALDVAERHGLGELVMRADAARRALQAGLEVRRPALPSTAPVGAAARVADAIRGARVLAG
jgi:tetratricopeptide (TPR) repeat protein